MSANAGSSASAAWSLVSPRSGLEWRLVCGVEVHCQLKTASKLFCGCRNEFGAPPNTLVCALCSGQPGTLPVLNREALQLALRAALALDAAVAPWSKFDRKNYFYADLPKGYQISQFDVPYCTGGGIRLAGGKLVRLRRIHLEEDAGKAIHDRGSTTLVDYNRAGVPLIESVTEPDLASPDEAHEYLCALKEALQFAGVSDCDMEKGSLRVDVNISVNRPGEPWRTRVELKNLNSFANVKAAIEHEARRQIGAWESGAANAVVQETRLYDAVLGETRSMRTKEEAHDYRYFPEPDLPRVHVDEALLAEARAKLGERPAAKRERYVRELGLSEYDAGVLTSSPHLARWFEAAAAASARPKESANWIQNEILRALRDQGKPAAAITELPLRPAELAGLIALESAGRLNAPAARRVLAAMLESGGAAEEHMRRLGLEQVNDTAQLEGWCRAALAGKHQAIADVKAGKHKALGAVVGPVMKASGGKANPAVVNEILLRIIQQEF